MNIIENILFPIKKAIKLRNIIPVIIIFSFVNTASAQLFEVYNQMGKDAYESGYYKQAEKHWLRAKEEAIKKNGKRHSDYATSLNNLAGLYKAQGRYTKAEPLYLEAKNILEKTPLGKKHPGYAKSLDGLARLYDVQGRYTKAEPLFLKALKTREKALGKNHSLYAASLNNLAGLYKAQGRYTKAEPLYLEALKNLENTLGKKHPTYVITLNNLANLYKTQSRYTKAEQLLLEALKTIEKNPPPHHILFRFASQSGSII